MSWEKYTLVIPTVSTGNVPQLATDLLLHNHAFAREVVLDSTFLYPFASPVDYTTEELQQLQQQGQEQRISGVSTGLELHVDETLKVAVVVQRSPVIPQYSRNFVEGLVDDVVVAARYGPFERVVVLDSKEAVVGGGGSGGIGGAADRVQVYSDDLVAGVERLQLGGTSESASEGQQQPPGGDRFSEYAQELLEVLAERATSTTSTTVLVINVYEGDNFEDARVLVERAGSVLGLPQDGRSAAMRTPKSWEGVYGDTPLAVGVEGLYR
jgi:proteasome chaperone 2